MIALAPDSPAAYRRAGDLNHFLGRHDEAAIYFEQAATLDPSDPRGHLAWALALQQEGRLDEAAHALRQGLELHPTDPELAFFLAAVGGQPAPTRAPDAFVARHFDRLAPSFDEHLQERLHYRAPELLLEQIRRVLGDATHLFDVLDAGCGTGLCGPLLRPLARRLVGVDLSPRMLDQARARGVYDELVSAELTAFLASASDQYDLIVATDVLIYVGDLEPLFRAAGDALRPGGLLAVSTERADQASYALQPTARYAHSPDYLRRTGEAAGLAEIDSRDCTLRLELAQPVPGRLSIFSRRGSAAGCRCSADRSAPG